MNLYFGNLIATGSTILVLATWVFIFITLANHKKIEFWGIKTAFLSILGLILCCFVSLRDGYDLSVQASIDSTITAGLFTVNSIQSTLCCIGGATIAFCALSTIFVKNQKYRKAMFLVLSSTIIVKTLIIEISRFAV